MHVDVQGGWHTCDMEDEGEEEPDVDAIPHGPDAAIQMPAQIPEYCIHIALPAPQPAVPFLQWGHLQGTRAQLQSSKGRIAVKTNRK